MDKFKRFNFINKAFKIDFLTFKVKIVFVILQKTLINILILDYFDLKYCI